MDLQKVCRLCLRIPKRPINLFENGLLEKIAVISSIQIENINELSDQICEECLKLLNISYSFRLVIINSNNDLNTRLKTLKDTNYVTKPRHKDLEYIQIYYVTEDIKVEPATELITKHPESKSVTQSESYQCDLCGKIYFEVTLLEHHKKRYHGCNSSTRNVVCNICGIELQICNLKKHILVKHTKEPSRCDECGKLCIHSDALKSHKKHHHSSKEHTCQICGKSYSLMCRLKIHLRYHTKEITRRKTCCSVCGKVVGSLKKHMLSHTGEKPYVCTYCNKGLTSTYALKIHVRTHTNERPYVCIHCGISYRQPGSLKGHLKSKHGIT